MSKSKNKSPMYAVILLVVVATGIVTVVSSFAATPDEGFAASEQNENTNSLFVQKAIDSIQNQ